MPSQWRNDQKGGGQATGKSAPSIPARSATGKLSRDNGSGAGTKVEPLKRVPAG